MAPVRETCAQTLGVALAQLATDRVRKVAELLASLSNHPQWEARHGALLGFKYLLAARQVSPSQLSLSFNILCLIINIG